MKKLVTGCAGIIGSAIIRRVFKNMSDVVVNVDALTYALNLEPLREVNLSDRCAVEHVKICDLAAIRWDDSQFSIEWSRVESLIVDQKHARASSYSRRLGTSELINQSLL